MDEKLKRTKINVLAHLLISKAYQQLNKNEEVLKYLKEIN